MRRPAACAWWVLLASFAVLLAVVAATSPSFFQLRNLLNVGTQAAMLAILAVGMSVVLIGGGIDLSLPSNMALAGILGSMAMIGADDVAPRLPRDGRLGRARPGR